MDADVGRAHSQFLDKRTITRRGEYMLARLLNILRFDIIPAIFYPLMKNHIYTVRYGLAKGLKRKGGLGFVPLKTRLTTEEKFIMSLDLHGQITYDVGAAHGIFTLFFAKLAGKNGRVVAFEPNPKLFRQIIENVKLNCFNNVEVLQIALGKERKRETLAFPSGELGIGSIEKHERARILSLKGAETAEVQVDSVDNLCAAGNIPKPDFVKIDVQGVEFDVLLGMKKTIQEYRPKILVEVHFIPYVDWRAKNVARTIEFLIAAGYSIYHVESERMLCSHDAQVVNEDEHLYCF